MTTASNLVFQVAGTTLYAYKADTGDELLALPFNLPGGAPPITYMVDGTQYIGFATGTQFMALKVGGTAAMPPPPPPGQFWPRWPGWPRGSAASPAGPRAAQLGPLGGPVCHLGHENARYRAGHHRWLCFRAGLS